MTSVVWKNAKGWYGWVCIHRCYGGAKVSSRRYAQRWYRPRLCQARESVDQERLGDHEGVFGELGWGDSNRKEVQEQRIENREKDTRCHLFRVRGWIQVLYN